MRVAVIGMGFMGGVHLKCWQSQADASVVAVCDTNPEIGKTVQGNVGPAEEERNLDKVAIYTDIAEMLAAETPDAVSITLPTHLHRDATVQCLEAGVHVLCEKPMALKLADCDAMISAAGKAGKLLMIAHCIRFWPEYAWLKDAVVSDRFGKVLTADFSRLTSAPGWSGDSWFSDPAKSGGIALDLHIHDLDFIQYLFGRPESQHSKAVRMDNGVAGHVATELKYDSGTPIRATASWLMPKSYGFSMSFNVVFERGAVVFDGNGLKVYPQDGDAYVPDSPDRDGYKEEISYFTSLIAGTEDQIIITPEEARESVRMALETMNS